MARTTTPDTGSDDKYKRAAPLNVEKLNLQLNNPDAAKIFVVGQAHESLADGVSPGADFLHIFGGAQNGQKNKFGGAHLRFGGAQGKMPLYLVLKGSKSIGAFGAENARYTLYFFLYCIFRPYWL